MAQPILIGSYLWLGHYYAGAVTTEHTVILNSSGMSYFVGTKPEPGDVCIISVSRAGTTDQRGNLMPPGFDSLVSIYRNSIIDVTFEVGVKELDGLDAEGITFPAVSGTRVLIATIWRNVNVEDILVTTSQNSNSIEPSPPAAVSAHGPETTYMVIGAQAGTGNSDPERSQRPPGLSPAPGHWLSGYNGYTSYEAGLAFGVNSDRYADTPYVPVAWQTESADPGGSGDTWAAATLVLNPTATVGFPAPTGVPIFLGSAAQAFNGNRYKTIPTTDILDENGDPVTLQPGDTIIGVYGYAGTNGNETDKLKIANFQPFGVGYAVRDTINSNLWAGFRHLGSVVPTEFGVGKENNLSSQVQGRVLALYAYRNLDVNQLDITFATGDSGSNPNPPGVTVADDADHVSFGGFMAYSQTYSTFVFNDPPEATAGTIFKADAAGFNNRATGLIATKKMPGEGSFDPAVFTRPEGSGGVSSSWVAWTIDTEYTPAPAATRRHRTFIPY